MRNEVTLNLKIEPKFEQKHFSGDTAPSVPIKSGHGAGDASYSELFWSTWDWIDKLYLSYQTTNLAERNN